MPEKIITVQGVTVILQGKKILEDINFNINIGDFIGLTGPNGAGKSTLIKTILGLLPLSTGTIKIKGKNNQNPSSLNSIGYLPQKNSLINHLIPATSEEVIKTGLNIENIFHQYVKREFHQIQVKKIITKLNLNKIRNKVFSNLSGGEQQWILLARALVTEPDLLILDEPSVALDIERRMSFFKLMRELNKKNTTIIIITHDTGYIGNYANKILHLDKKINFFGELKKVRPIRKAAPYFEKVEEHFIWHKHD